MGLSQAAEHLALPVENRLQGRIAAVVLDFTDTGHERSFLSQRRDPNANGRDEATDLFSCAPSHDWRYHRHAAIVKKEQASHAPQRGGRMTRVGGLSYGWIVVAAGALMTCISMGSMFSLAVFLQPMSEDTGWSRTGISTAMTIDFLAMGFAAFGWGALSDRFGTRIVVLMGSLLLGLGLVLASRASSLIEFQLMFGLVVGVAAGAFYAPLMAVASGWFEHNRSLAVALVSAGMGVAPLTVAPFARWLITTYDWRPAMMIVGIVATILMVPAALLVRRPPVVLDPNPPAPGVATPVAAMVEPRMSAGEALRTPQFAALALAHFACCAAHSGPIFHMVAFALGCGLPAMVAVSVYSLAGFSGLGGRLLLGVLADRLGAKQVLVAGLMVQALGAGAYLFVRELGELYALSVRVRHRLWRRDAALRHPGARVFRRAHHGHGVRRDLGAGEPRHGLRSVGRRLGVRHLCELLVALHRLVLDRPRRRGGGAHLQAGARRGQAQDGSLTSTPGAA